VWRARRPVPRRCDISGNRGMEALAAFVSRHRRQRCAPIWPTAPPPARPSQAPLGPLGARHRSRPGRCYKRGPSASKSAAIAAISARRASGSFRERVWSIIRVAVPARAHRSASANAACSISASSAGRPASRATVSSARCAVAMSSLLRQNLTQSVAGFRCCGTRGCTVRSMTPANMRDGRQPPRS